MSVRAPTKAVAAMGEGWPLVTDLLGGTDAMRAAGTKRLPQWPNEASDAYSARLSTATLFPAFARTIDVLGGKPFSKPVTLSDDVPARIQEWCADIDLQGRDLHAFAASLCAASLAYGIVGILVDYPLATGVRTAADEKASGLRPYFVEIPATSLLGWRSQRVNGVEMLTQLRFVETVCEPDGAFGEAEIEQVRVLYPGRWEIWRKPGNGDWAVHASGVTTLGKIPFVPVYGNRTGFLRATPPLLELAHLNVEHWQSKSDQQTILHVARVPILFAKKLGDATIVVGGSSAVQADDADADLKFVEHSGKAIEAGRVSLLDLEDRMRQIGAELLIIKPGNTSITQTRADNEPGMCVLQRIVQDQEQALGNALDLMAEWVGEEIEAKVSIYQDFGVSNLAEASAQMLFEMKVDGSLSHKTLLSEIKRRGLIAPELDLDEEIKQANIEKAAAAAAGAGEQRKENDNI